MEIDEEKKSKSRGRILGELPYLQSKRRGIQVENSPHKEPNDKKQTNTTIPQKDKQNNQLVQNRMKENAQFKKLHGGKTSNTFY